MLQPGFHIQVVRFDIMPQLRKVGQPASGVRAPNEEQLGVLIKKDTGNSEQRVRVRHASHSSGDDWLILQEKLPPQNASEQRWSLNRTDEQVFLPMFDYLLPDPAPEVLVHLGAQTGALAMSLLPAELRVKKMFLAIGNVLRRPDGKPGYQAWIGFAAAVEKG